MGLKTILVTLTSEDHAETLLKAAIPLARRHHAHLVGLHAMETLAVYPSISMHIPGPVYDQFNASQRETAARVREIFETLTRTEDFACEWRQIKADAASSADAIIESARAADVVIMAQEIRQWDKADYLDEQIRTIRESGCPVIVIPQNYEGPEIGSSILLGWSETREATRAAHDARMLVSDGAVFDILRVAPPGDELEDLCTIEIAESFDRHGLKVKVIRRENPGHSVADMLLHEAKETGADLIAVGAFGHSRLYDFTIGAATRELLSGTTLPVLFSK